MTDITGAALAVLLAAGASVATPEEPRNPYPQEAPWIDKGRGIYGRYSCPMCHGMNARGGAGPDLTDERWIFAPTDRMLFETIRNGRRGTMMPGYADELADEQIWLVVSWLRSEHARRRVEDAAAGNPAR